MKLDDKILKAMVSMDSIADSGIAYHGMNDNALMLKGNICEFCSFCLKHPAASSRCRYSCIGASMQSLTSGEPCYQRCWAGLLYLSVSVAPKGSCVGGLSIGGFYSPGEEAETARLVCEQLADLQAKDRQVFLSKLHTVRQITPSDLRGMGLLLFETTISSGINSADFFRKQNDKYLQQRSIADTFENLKQETQSHSDLLSDTQHLIQFLHGKEREESMRVISDYLARVLMMSHWDIRKLKAHAKIIIAIISSREIMNGADWQTATARETRLVNRLFACSSVEDCCLEITDQVLKHLGRSTGNQNASGSISEKVIAYIETNFATQFNLQQMARTVGASLSSITHITRKETGRSCSRLLQETRVNEAKKLLATSDLELSAVAAACGFYDQSHFTRTFKNNVNLTPGQFKRLLDFTSKDI